MWASLGPKARTEFHPGRQGRDMVKVWRPGRRPPLHRIPHRSSFLQGVCWSPANPQFSEGWEGKGKNFSSWQILCGRKEEGVEATGSASLEEEGVAGKEEAQERHFNLAMSVQSQWNSEPLPILEFGSYGDIL